MNYILQQKVYCVLISSSLNINAKMSGNYFIKHTLDYLYTYNP